MPISRTHLLDSTACLSSVRAHNRSLPKSPRLASIGSICLITQSTNVFQANPRFVSLRIAFELSGVRLLSIHAPLPAALCRETCDTQKRSTHARADLLDLHQHRQRAFGPVH